VHGFAFVELRADAASQRGRLSQRKRASASSSAKICAVPELPVAADLDAHPGVLLDVADVVGAVAVLGDDPELLVAQPVANRHASRQAARAAGCLDQRLRARPQAALKQRPGQAIEQLIGDKRIAGPLDRAAACRQTALRALGGLRRLRGGRSFHAAALTMKAIAPPPMTSLG
jgi:hypothetical protein